MQLAVSGAFAPSSFSVSTTALLEAMGGTECEAGVTDHLRDCFDTKTAVKCVDHKYACGKEWVQKSMPWQALNRPAGSTSECR